VERAESTPQPAYSTEQAGSIAYQPIEQTVTSYGTTAGYETTTEPATEYQAEYQTDYQTEYQASPESFTQEPFSEVLPDLSIQDLDPDLNLEEQPAAAPIAYSTTAPAPFTGSQEELIVHSQRNCLYIDPTSMNRLQQEVSVSRLLQPGLYTIKLKSGTFDYQIESGHVGEPLVLLWIYGGKVVNQKVGVEVGATWSSLNGYGDLLILRVIEPATLCGFFFDTYLEDNEGEVVVSVEGAGYSEDLTVHSKHNCYFIDPETMRQLEQEVGVSRKLESGNYTISINSGSFNYRNSGNQGEPIVLLWIYGGKVVNRQTGVEVAATWSSLNGYSDMLHLNVREPATICAFFFDTYLEDNQGEISLAITKA
jgi:hypothetical protein